MAESYVIANVSEIKNTFGVTLDTNLRWCPTYSTITADSSLGVSGATYAANQLVLKKHIYKKAVPVTKYTLTISNLDEFLSAKGYDIEDGIWELYVGNTSYDGGSYPTSYLMYNTNNRIEGTQAQWTALYNVLDNNTYWNSIELVNTAIENGRFNLNDNIEVSIKALFTDLKNGNNKTISLIVPTVGSAVVDLNNEWTTGSTNPSSSAYYSFESSKNKGVAKSGDYIYLKIKGYNTYTLYIRSNGENNYDYVMVSKPNASITYSTPYSSSNVYAHTRGLATSGTSLSDYKKVTFTGLTTAEHTITIVYRKDSSGDVGDDAGYVLIPKDNASYENMYLSTGGSITPPITGTPINPTGSTSTRNITIYISTYSFPVSRLRINTAYYQTGSTLSAAQSAQQVGISSLQGEFTGLTTSTSAKTAIITVPANAYVSIYLSNPYGSAGSTTLTQYSWTEGNRQNVSPGTGATSVRFTVNGSVS